MKCKTYRHSKISKIDKPKDLHANDRSSFFFIHCLRREIVALAVRSYECVWDKCSNDSPKMEIGERKKLLQNIVLYKSIRRWAFFIWFSSIQSIKYVFFSCSVRLSNLLAIHSKEILRFIMDLKSIII